MGFRKYVQTSWIGCALLMLTAGVYFSGTAVGQTATITSPPNGTEINFVTGNANLPPAIPVEMSVTTTGLTTLVSGRIDSDITTDVDGTETSPGSGEWMVMMDLLSDSQATDPGSNVARSFISSLTAIGHYYLSTWSSSPVNVTVNLFPISLIDSVHDGDPIPDDIMLNTILPADTGSSVSLVDPDSGITTILESADGTGATIETGIASTGDAVVVSPASETVPEFSSFLNVVVMVTASSSADTLTNSTDPVTPVTFEAMYIRVVVLGENPADVWTPYTGLLPSGFQVDISFDLGAAFNAANVFQLLVDRKLDPPTGSHYETAAEADWVEFTNTSVDINGLVTIDLSGELSNFLMGVRLDTSVPVIVLNGLENVFIECGVETYTELFATASDNVNASLPVIIESDNVNEAVPGTYAVEYSAKNAVTTTFKTRTVTVQDTIKPVITLTGPSSILHAFNQPYADQGATIVEACDTSLTVTVAGDDFDPGMIGTYFVTYNATDASGNIADEVVRTVEVTRLPVVTLNGLSLIELECRVNVTAFVDPGATAIDETGSITVVVGGATVLDALGDYVITYSATNGFGTTVIERTVSVLDTIAPVLSLNGLATVFVAVNGTYTELNVSIVEACDTGLIATIGGSVDTGTPDTYILTYNAEDASGNIGLEVTRTVNVVSAPVVALVGSSSLTLECGIQAYSESGASASDNLGSLTVTITGSVVDAVGVYVLTYSATNIAGTTSVNRTVTVVDTTKPVITVIGDPSPTIGVFSFYTELGASVADACDTSLTTAIVGGAIVDTSTVGTYVVTYNATDAYGNVAIEVTRTVSVTDVPVVVLNGPAALTLECGVDTYIELGATATDLDGAVTVVIGGDPVIEGTPGTYVVQYSATNDSGTTFVLRTVTVQDTLSPEMTLNGSESVVLVAGAETYTELGVTILDLCDDMVFVVISGDTVNDDVVGVYEVIYNATDASGNSAAQLIRTVTIGAGISFVEPADGDILRFYTPEGDIPTEVFLEVELSAPVGTQSIVVGVDGSTPVSATKIGSSWFAVVDLTNATDLGTNSAFDVTLNAIGIINSLGSIVVSSVSLVLDVGIRDADSIDSILDGDPIPDDSNINEILATNGVIIGTSRQGNLIVTELDSIMGSTGEISIDIPLAGGGVAEVSVQAPSINRIDPGPFQSATNVVMMLTATRLADDLSGGGVSPTPVADFQGVFTRFVILIERPRDVWGPYTGLLPDGFVFQIKITQTDAVTGANVYQFNLDRVDGAYVPVTNPAWLEVETAGASSARALVSDGVISAGLARANIVLGARTDGGGAPQIIEEDDSDDSSGGGGGCFIATAAYGTPMAQEIDTLRSVRDTYMLNNAAGSVFVDTYYRLSPPIADRVAESPFLGALVRVILTPFVWLSKVILAAPLLVAGLMAGYAGLFLASRKRVRRRS